MQFEVRVYRDNAIASIVLEATSADDARQQASAQALRPLSVKPVRTSGVVFVRARRRGRFDLLLFSQELLSLMQAGLAIIESLETLAQREHTGETQIVLADLATRLREGKSFSGALETLPFVFPQLFVGIVRSAERTGDLQPALERYIDYRVRLDALKGKLISAAIYPALLLIVGAAVTLFLAGYVVPRFAAVYQGTGRTLPWASAALLEWGHFANAHVYTLLTVAGFCIGAVILWARTGHERGLWRELLARTPLISERLHTYELSRLYLMLGMLLDSGLPVMPSLALGQAAQASHISTAIEKASVFIRQGERLSSAFERTGLTTAVGLRMMRVGEESGRLGEMMTRAARFHDGEIARWIERFSRAAEPVLMIAIGLVVGTIVVLLYMPIFDLAGSLR